MSYLKSIGAAVIYIGTFLALITFMPGLPPYTEFQEYSITPPRALDPKVGPKNRLTGAQKLFEGEINGPEGFDSYNGQLYTGVHDGYVLRIEDDRTVPIVKFGVRDPEEHGQHWISFGTALTPRIDTGRAIRLEGPAIMCASE